MIPLNTKIEDIETVLSFMSRQVGWVAIDKAKKSLDAKVLDDRKVAAMAYLKLIDRDGNNLKITDRGMRFSGGDRVGPLRQGMLQSELYGPTLEWLHFGNRAEVTAVEVGQYWQAQHMDGIGDANGDRLKDGAVFFFRVADAAGLGRLTIGRGGKETRFTPVPTELTALLDSQNEQLLGSESSENGEEGRVGDPNADSDVTHIPTPTPGSQAPLLNAAQPPTVSVSTSPSVHVNVEIHIAADATAETVKEIFKNMARYVLDKHVDD